MERLSLSVWFALVFGTLVGAADDRRGAVTDGFPSLPVPAGDTLTQAHVNLRKGLVFDWQVPATQETLGCTCHQTENVGRCVSEKRGLEAVGGVPTTEAQGPGWHPVSIECFPM